MQLLTVHTFIIFILHVELFTAKDDKSEKFLRQLSVKIGDSFALYPTDIHGIPVNKNQRGRICLVEIEEYNPFHFMVGHLEPKKFSCDFKYGDVVYYHNGNPLFSEDIAKMSIFFKSDSQATAYVSTVELKITVINSTENAEYRSQHLKQIKLLNVNGPRSLSESIDPAHLEINFDPHTEECRLSFTAPNYDCKTDENIEPWIDSTIVPRYGMPLRPGPASGGSQRWPLFGSLVYFNRSTINSFEFECQSALLMGIRYSHEKGNGPDTDYIPITVMILRRNSDASANIVARKGLFLRIKIYNTVLLKKPFFRTIDQVDLNDFGGTISVLPKNSLIIPADIVPEEDHLDVKIIKIETYVKVQVLNMRDPTRPVMGFRVRELRAGYVGFQYLEHTHSTEKVSKLHLKLYDPFGKSSEEVVLVVKSKLQHILDNRFIDGSDSTLTFQVFTFPMYVDTLEETLTPILPHNIQVLGYIEENDIGIKIKREQRKTFFGDLVINGRSFDEKAFKLSSLNNSQVHYKCRTSFGTRIDHLLLSIGVKGYGFINITDNRSNVQNNSIENIFIHPILELPVRIFRIYDDYNSFVLKTGNITNILHRSHICFSSEMLIDKNALISLRSDLPKVSFAVRSSPTQGLLIRKSTLASYGANFNELVRNLSNYSNMHMNFSSTYIFYPSVISKFDIWELELGEICYINQRNELDHDFFELQQVFTNKMKSAYYNIYFNSAKLNPEYVIEEFEKLPIELSETTSYTVLNSSHLGYRVIIEENDINDDEPIFEITMPPTYAMELNHTLDAGRVVSLSSLKTNNLIGDTKLQALIINSPREIQPPMVKFFTQKMLDDGDIVYIPPNKDVGFDKKVIVIKYSLICPNRKSYFDKILELIIVPQDNQKPIIDLISPIRVERDHKIALNSNFIIFYDEDTKSDELEIFVLKQPTYGRLLIITFDNVTIETTSNQSFQVSNFYKEKIFYQQAGFNVREDSITLLLSDGRQNSGAVEIFIEITDRNIEKETSIDLSSNNFVVEENKTIVLNASHFGLQSLNLNARFFTASPPTLGKIINISRSIEQEVCDFHALDINCGNIAYEHIPVEIGSERVFDSFSFLELSTFDTFFINFTIMPVNSQPPVLKALGTLDVQEGGSILLTNSVFSIHDPDSRKNEIIFHVFKPPRWGIIEVEGVERSNFSLIQLQMREVRYINKYHKDGIEVTEDEFMLQARDEFIESNIIRIHVVIEPVNDEIPYVRLLKCMSVPANQQIFLTPHIFAVEDNDIPQNKIHITFTDLPRYGLLQQYWKHGETSIFSQRNANIMLHHLRMLSIAYQPDKYLNMTQNDTLIDTFAIRVNDGNHSVEKRSRILIRQANNFAPVMNVDGDGLVLDSISWKSLYARPGGLIVDDIDTVSEDLLIIVDDPPKLGILTRFGRIMSRFVSEIPIREWIEEAWDDEEEKAAELGLDPQMMLEAGSVGGFKGDKMLIKNSRFTKFQLMQSRINYIYTGKYTQDFIEDSCTLRVTDGKFESKPVTLFIRIRRTSKKENEIRSNVKNSTESEGI